MKWKIELDPLVRQIERELMPRAIGTIAEQRKKKSGPPSQGILLLHRVQCCNGGAREELIEFDFLLVFFVGFPEFNGCRWKKVLISFHAPRRYFGLFQKFFLIIWLWANNHLCCHNTQRGIFVLPNNSMPPDSGMGTIYLPTRTALSMVCCVNGGRPTRRGARNTFLTYLTEVGGSQHDILFFLL